MAVSARITGNRAQAHAALRGLGDRVYRSAVTLAVNDTGKQVQTHAIRVVAKASGLKVGIVRPAFRLLRASSGSMEAKVRASGRPFRLIDFAARQTRAGATANAYGQRKVYRSTFIAQMKSGYRQVFTRRGKGRFPVKQLWGPGVPDTLAKEAVMEGVLIYGGERLQANILRQIDRALRKSRGYA